MLLTMTRIAFAATPLRLGAFYALLGVFALWTAANVHFAKADQHPIWGFLTRSLRVFGSPLIAGGRKRYLRLIGWVLTIIGAMILLGWAFGGEAA